MLVLATNGTIGEGGESTKEAGSHKNYYLLVFAIYKYLIFTGYFFIAFFFKISLAMIIIIKTVSIIPKWHDRFGTIIHCRSFYSLDIVFKTVVGPFYRKYYLLIVFLIVF
jgi:hypothetical protein